jgi:hypothetical protein
MSIADITAEERDALRHQVLTHLEALDDLTIAFKAGEFERARRLGIEFGDELRLMQDLGWGDVPAGGDAIKLTMPPQELRRLFIRLRSDAESLRADEEREQAEERRAVKAHRDQVQRVTDACERVLSVVQEGHR